MDVPVFPIRQVSIARTLHIRDRLAKRCLDGRWMPSECDQQRLVAALDNMDDRWRLAIIRALTGWSGTCAACQSVLRICWMSTIADLALLCSGGCRLDREFVLAIELKPWGAAPHWSSADLRLFTMALEQGIIRDLGMHLPATSCVAGRRCPTTCLHPVHYRNGGPALPQVVVAAYELGVPVLVLAERDCDATALYRTMEDGIELGPTIVTRSIETVLREVAVSLQPDWNNPSLSGADREAISWAIAGLWARQGWESWLRTTPLVRGLLPVEVAQAIS